MAFSRPTGLNKSFAISKLATAPNTPKHQSADVKFIRLIKDDKNLHYIFAVGQGIKVWEKLQKKTNKELNAYLSELKPEVLTAVKANAKKAELTLKETVLSIAGGLGKQTVTNHFSNVYTSAKSYTFASDEFMESAMNILCEENGIDIDEILTSLPAPEEDNSSANLEYVATSYLSQVESASIYDGTVLAFSNPKLKQLNRINKANTASDTVEDVQPTNSLNDLLG